MELYKLIGIGALSVAFAFVLFCIFILIEIWVEKFKNK